jgi:hypothetical protein
MNVITPYKGRAEIKCLADQCTQDISRRDVDKDCFACELSETTMIDLDEKPVGIIKKKSKPTMKIQEVTDDGV